MTRVVYQDKKFIEFSRSQIFMRVFQDTEREGNRLARRFQIEGFPTLIILDSSGREVDRLLGARDAGTLIDELKDIFESAGEPREIITI